MIYLDILKKKKFAYPLGECVFRASQSQGPAAGICGKAAMASSAATSVPVALSEKVDHTVMTKLRYLRKGKKRISGRNNQGRITVRRRGGGHKRNYRFVSFGFSFHPLTEPQEPIIVNEGHVNSAGLWVKKNSLEFSKLTKGLRGTVEYMVHDLVYDPNRSAPLALVAPIHSQGHLKKKNLSDALNSVTALEFKYILAPKGIVPGDIIKIWNVSLGWRPLKSKEVPITSRYLRSPTFGAEGTFGGSPLGGGEGGVASPKASPKAKDLMTLRPSLGDSLPLSQIPLGSIIHNIEEQPGKGGQYIRAGGGYGQILDILPQGDASSSLGQNGIVSQMGSPLGGSWDSAKEKKKRSKVLVRLPSGEKKWFPSNGRASIGAVSLRSVLKEGAHESPIRDDAVRMGADATVSGSSSVFVGKKGKGTLGKAGRSRWLGRRPKVRGVAMNPVDHPHGGGEGRTSGGRPSVTPWGRLTKGWKTRSAAKKKKAIRVL